VSAEVAGRVAEVAVRDNQTVTKGQLLFRIDHVPFDMAVARARAQLASARTEVETLRAELRVALADALMDLDRTEDARRVVAQLLAYAPDNPRALYYAAYLAAQAGQDEEAKAYLALLFTVERDPDGLKRARALQMFLDQKIPPRAGAPRDG